MKKIWYSQRVHFKKEYEERWDAADQKIGEFLYWCGFLPIAVPSNIDILSCMAEEVPPDGIILTGGNNLVKYGGDAPERDQAEKWIINFARDNRIPLLGICRGMQVILDYFGYELRQVDNHVGTRHELTGNFNGVRVNSFHRLGLYDYDIAGSQQKINACSKDGVVESIKIENENISGIMWHPERERKFSERDRKYLIEIFGED